jgi:RHS repeat-associated protein
LQTLTHQHGGNTLASYGLTYDNANRIIQSAGTDGIQDYSYDSTNQLTTADHSTQTDEAYSYDANGNRTNAGYGTGTNNQLLTDGTYNYEYDGEGNRTLRTEIATGKVTEYRWDYRNRLTSVQFKDAAGVVTKTIEYTYDVNDRRIGKKLDGVVTERYVYDREQISLVFDGAGSQTHRYLYGTQIDQVLADERGGTVVWALSDNQGTVRDIVDGNGTILNHVVYDSYGKVVGQSDASVEFRYGYTGREQDSETGLDYYRARYYDASNGRFISEDPLGFSAGDTNIYRYVANSPTNYNDPSGEQIALPFPVIPSIPIPIIPPWLVAPLIIIKGLDAGSVATGSPPTLKPKPNRTVTLDPPKVEVEVEVEKEKKPRPIPVKNEEKRREPTLKAFGNATKPSDPRLVKDFEIIGVDEDCAEVEPVYQPRPLGKSTFENVNFAPLTGKYYEIPKNRQYPELIIVADGKDVGGPAAPTHHTIMPAHKMKFTHFRDLFRALPWKFAGTKK